MLCISLTADYELFFGKNFQNEDEILINPTYMLLHIAKNNRVPVTLMADILSVWKYREYGLENYAQEVENQLKYAIKNGHDVQMHIHPHWINSKFQNGQWEFDSKIYKIQDLGFNTDNTLSANELISKSKRYLEELLKTENNKYKCVGFRAGGWCLQPEIELIKVLKATGINIDTTIYKYGYMKNKTHYFDYRNVPNSLNWYIDPAMGINNEANRTEDTIYEVSIGSLYKRPYIYYLKILNKVLRLNRKNIARGIPIDYNLNTKVYKKIYNKINKFFIAPVMFSLDEFHGNVLLKIVKWYLKKYDCINKDYHISLICHPKCLHYDNFNDLDYFLKTINNNYKNLVLFETIQDIYIRGI